VELRQLGPTGVLQGPGTHQATFMSLSRCSLTSEEVRNYYLSGGPEAHESTGILFVETQVRGSKLQLAWTPGLGLQGNLGWLVWWWWGVMAGSGGGGGQRISRSQSLEAQPCPLPQGPIQPPYQCLPWN
jgi:hypothetical protein